MGINFSYIVTEAYHVWGVCTRTLEGVGNSTNRAVTNCFREIEQSCLPNADDAQRGTITGERHAPCVTHAEKFCGSVQWGQRGALALFIAAYFSMKVRALSLFAPLSKVGMVAALLIIHDLGKMRDVLWEAKKGAKPLVLSKCRSMLRMNLLILNQGEVFHRAIVDLGTLTRERVRCQSCGGEQTEQSQEVREPSQEVSTVISPERVQTSVENWMKLVGSIRATAIKSALALYVIHAYTSLFSTVACVGSVVASFLAYEAHNIHEAVRLEVSQPLLKGGKGSISEDQRNLYFKAAYLKIREGSWLFGGRFFGYFDPNPWPALFLETQASQHLSQCFDSI